MYQNPKPTQQTLPRKTGFRQQGFTLVEILVVLGIIAFLASALTVTIATYLTSAREAQTVATLRKIDGLLTERQQALTRFFDSRDFNRRVEVVHDKLREGDPANGVAQLFGLAEDFVAVVGRKELLREALPQRFSEMVDVRNATGGFTADANGDGKADGDLIPDEIQLDEVYKVVTWTPWPGSVPPPQGYNVSHPSGVPRMVPFRDSNSNGTYDPGESLHDPRTESAELLYFALTRLEQFGLPAVAVGEFRTNEVADTDNDGLLEFVDGWGNPVRFYRWPTRMFKPFGLLGMDQAYGDISIDDDSNGSADDPTLDIDEIGWPASDDTYIHPAIRTFAGLYFDGLPRQPIQIEFPLGSGKFRPVTGDFDQLNEDGDDPFGVLLDETKRLTLTGVNVFSSVNESTYHTFDTYHKPLVVSAGADGVLGLFEPFHNEDVNLNGVLDTVAGEDVNSNGFLDIGWLAQPINEDIDLDGANGEDLNLNGKLDSGEDANGNGVLDTEPDINGNGEFDAFVRPLGALDDLTNRNRRAGG